VRGNYFTEHGILTRSASNSAVHLELSPKPLLTPDFFVYSYGMNEYCGSLFSSMGSPHFKATQGYLNLTQISTHTASDTSNLQTMAMIPTSDSLPVSIPICQPNSKKTGYYIGIVTRAVAARIPAIAPYTFSAPEFASQFYR
jgi:hypothetical protein